MVKALEKFREFSMLMSYTGIRVRHCETANGGKDHETLMEDLP
jgi:hypothetical protein